MRLPPELRNLVYEHALVKEDVIDLSIIDATCRSNSLRDIPHIRNSRREIQTLVQQPPLTLVCVEIRRQALPIFYRCNMFLLDLEYAHSYQAMATIKWLTAIGSQNRRMLDHVYLFSDGIHLEDVVEAFAEDKVALTTIRPKGKLAQYMGPGGGGRGNWSKDDDGADVEADDTLYLKLGFEKP